MQEVQAKNQFSDTQCMDYLDIKMELDINPSNSGFLANNQSTRWGSCGLWLSYSLKMHLL